MSEHKASPADNLSPSSNESSGKNDDQNLELQDLTNSPQASGQLPIEEDLMQLARLGEIKAIQKLFDDEKFDATYTDDQGITPLHWAAINNHYALCHFLIESGAKINAKGGDAEATPVLWAAKRCHYYIVHLLLQHGADPLITDNGGFNLLHSATLDGNVFQLVLLLHQDIQIDIPDEQGHTSLMWAAYKGFPACVDLFLRWGANVYARDDQGFTALHWALVKGSQAAIQKLVEYGSDRFAENNDGKTPASTADEMDTKRQWHKALSECGYNPNGTPKYFPLASVVKDRRTFFSRFFLFWPFLIMYTPLWICSHAPIYFAIPLSFAVAFGLQWLAIQTLKWAPPDMNNIHKTPFLSGVFAGTLFWTGVTWLTALLPYTFKVRPILNLFFFVVFSLCLFFYILTMNTDPGYIPKPGSRTSQKAIIDELMEARKFDDKNFCVHCTVRKPLRSKHCKRCNRCVAKEDHHCPWVDNCVGVNNHRHFVMFILFMQLGIVDFISLVLSYLEVVPAPKDAKCSIVKDEICEILNKDPFTITLACMCVIHLVWVTMLILVQLVQIGRALTTFESMRGHTHQGAPDTVTSFLTTGAMSMEGGQINNAGAGPATGLGIQAENAPHRHGHGHQKRGFCEQWKRLLGIDTFVATAFGGSASKRRSQAVQRQNAFSRGLLTNCKDFWLDPAPFFGKRENGMAMLEGQRVDYTRLYDPPPKMAMRRRGGGETYVAVDTDDNV